MGFEFDSRNYIDGYFGVTRRNGKVDLNLCLENDEVKSLLKNVKKPLSKSTQWWITWGWYEKGDLFDYILEKGDVEQSVKDFVDAFYSIFDSYNEVVLKCNQVLE